MELDERDQLQSAILGLAVGDALGVPVEFKSRSERAHSPVTGMRAFGTHNQPAGTWSDDTSMVLATLDSLASDLQSRLPVEHQDYQGLMARFAAWLDHSRYTPYGQTFDVGGTTARAIGHFNRGVQPLECGCTGDLDNGNGSLMRILPAVFYLHAAFGPDFGKWVDHLASCQANIKVELQANPLTEHQADRQAFTVIHNLSSLTHAHPRSQLACGIYCCIAAALLSKPGLPLSIAVNTGLIKALDYYGGRKLYAIELDHFRRLFSHNFQSLPEKSIRSSGYVVDTLEAAVWCLLNTGNYRDCVLKAVNLGEDTDTVAAVAGGLAGLHYGRAAIPQEWLDVLARKSFIIELCERFSEAQA